MDLVKKVIKSDPLNFKEGYFISIIFKEGFYGLAEKIYLSEPKLFKSYAISNSAKEKYKQFIDHITDKKRLENTEEVKKLYEGFKKGKSGDITFSIFEHVMVLVSNEHYKPSLENKNKPPVKQKKREQNRGIS